MRLKGGQEQGSRTTRHADQIHPDQGQGASPSMGEKAALERHAHSGPENEQQVFTTSPMDRRHCSRRSTQIG